MKEWLIQAAIVFLGAAMVTLAVCLVMLIALYGPGHQVTLRLNPAPAPMPSFTPTVLPSYDIQTAIPYRP